MPLNLEDKKVLVTEVAEVANWRRGCDANHRDATELGGNVHARQPTSRDSNAPAPGAEDHRMTQAPPGALKGRRPRHD